MLGTDLGGGNVHISLVLKCVRKAVFFHVFIYCFILFVFCRLDKKHENIIVISGGQNVNIMLVFIGCSEMSVFSQVRFLNELFEKSKGEKRTWANPVGSKQWKSMYEIDNFICLFVYVFFVF